jgi:hypothetical protein
VVVSAGEWADESAGGSVAELADASAGASVGASVGESAGESAAGSEAGWGSGLARVSEVVWGKKSAPAWSGGKSAVWWEARSGGKSAVWWEAGLAGL